MRAIKTQKGFTIVETLIVLAVTGALFVATSILVSGQIQRYQFRDSALNMEQRLVDVINDVRVGYFGIQAGTGSGPTANVPPGQCSTPAVSTSDPGKSNCLYVGKKVVIDEANNKFIVSSLVSAIDEGDLVGKSPSTAFVSQGPNPYELSKIESDLPSGLDYSQGTTFYVLFDRFGTNSDPLNNKGEGQSVSIYGVDGSGNINKSSSGFVICASNGNRYASYRLGVNGNSNVELRFSKETTWGC